MGMTAIKEKSSVDQSPSSEKDELANRAILYSVLQDDVQKRLNELKSPGTQVSPVEFDKPYGPSKAVSYFQIPELLLENFNKRKKFYSYTQKWVGHIVVINNGTFTAKLDDLNDPTTYEMAQFDMKDVPFEDRELVTIGAGFYLSLGYVNDNGQVEKKSLIRFQRTTPWSESEVDTIADRSENLFKRIEKWG